MDFGPAFIVKPRSSRICRSTAKVARSMVRLTLLLIARTGRAGRQTVGYLATSSMPTPSTARKARGAEFHVPGEAGQERFRGGGGQVEWRRLPLLRENETRAGR